MTGENRGPFPTARGRTQALGREQHLAGGERSLRGAEQPGWRRPGSCSWEGGGQPEARPLSREPELTQGSVQGALAARPAAGAQGCPVLDSSWVVSDPVHVPRPQRPVALAQRPPRPRTPQPCLLGCERRAAPQGVLSLVLPFPRLGPCLVASLGHAACVHRPSDSCPFLPGRAPAHTSSRPCPHDQVRA